jgi:hypothetical protein
MSDQSVANHIERLVAEEHALRNREQVDTDDPASLEQDREKLQAVQVELDRAIRSAGGDPDDAELRDADTVEHYRQ